MAESRQSQGRKYACCSTYGEDREPFVVGTHWYEGEKSEPRSLRAGLRRCGTYTWRHVGRRSYASSGEYARQLDRNGERHTYV